MGKVFSGSRGALKINGKKIAFIGGVSVQESNMLERINILDQLESAELTEVGHEVSLTANYFKAIDQSTIELGLRPENLRDMLNQGDLIIEIYNSVEDKVEYTVIGAKIESIDGSMDARSVFKGSIRFMGRIGSGL